MLLAIDVGNTNTTFAVFEDARIIANWRIETAARRTEDEYSVILDALLARDGLNCRQIDGVIVSSVVPTTIDPLVRMARDFFGVKSTVVVGRGEDVGIGVRYQPRTDVGADRIANAVAAHNIYGGPVIVVDFGTATTFDAIAEDGTYLGGAIAPGVETSVEALVAKTAQLRRVEYSKPDSVIGTSTVESLQSGIVFGFAGQVDGIVERMKEEIGGSVKVVATGGLAEIVGAESRTIEEIDPLLTLKGLQIIYSRSIAP
jgi:type III pantothenate kinase